MGHRGGRRAESTLQGVQPLYRSVVLPPCPTRGAAILQSVRAGWGRGYRTVVPSPSRRSSGGRGQGREGAAQRRIIAAALLGPLLPHFPQDARTHAEGAINPGDRN